MTYIENKRVWLKSHPEFREKWVQDRIAENPSILGLGDDLVLRARERTQPRAGRLDLLLQSQDTGRRYEVELQLGPVDESHIIRTIEYWDIERKHYPQYEHCAVLVAEDVTSRFLNVMALFNGVIPLIAIQMQALQIGNNITLSFSTVMDELKLGLVDDDEEAQSAPADRAHWEGKTTPETMALADKLLEITQEAVPSEQLERNYTKNYIGLSKGGQGFNFVSFQPKKKNVGLWIRIPKTNETDQEIDDNEIDSLPYENRWNQYRLTLTRDDIEQKREFLQKLIKYAYEYRTR